MATTIPDMTISLESHSAAQWLRRIAAAVRVHFTWWGTRKTLTPEQKEAFGATCDADSRLLTATKRIIDIRHPSFRKLTSIKSRATSYWRGITLPYTEPGIRLLRQSEVDAFVHMMEGFQTELVEAETELNQVYDELKRDARQRLGRLFHANDYPAALEKLFHVEWDFPSVEPPQYLMRLNPDLYREEQQRVAQRFEDAVRLAEQAFVSEFAKLVSHLTERLSSGPDSERKVFRDTAVSNLTEFFERFRQLNVQSNAQLDVLVNQAQDLVRGIRPQALRENESLRQQVATQLSQVQAVLDGMMIDVPRRRIVRPTLTRNEADHADTN